MFRGQRSSQKTGCLIGVFVEIMNPMRKKRLEALAVRDLSELIMRRRLKDDRIGLVSVTGVKLTQDLEIGRAHV